MKSKQRKHYDTLILGAGAAGLFCAGLLGKRGKRVLVLEKQSRPGLKILISGGGRCNFTNLRVSAEDYLSENPNFCKPALAAYPPEKFIQLVERYRIPYHEKERGQLFCDHSAKDILHLLMEECRSAKAQIRCSALIQEVQKTKDGFQVRTSDEIYEASELVVATGGLSFTKLGASDLGYRIAEQWGHKVISTRPALTPLLWNELDRKFWGNLTGLSCPVAIQLNHGARPILETGNLLFTHQGISGPAILRTSLHWQKGDALWVNFSPERDLAKIFAKAQKQNPKRLPKSTLATLLPTRLAEKLSQHFGLLRPLKNTAPKKLLYFTEQLHHFNLHPEKLAGYDKAEVTAGGVDTREISPQTMESQLCPGLFFIGEVLDVTGDLGGYNFQWAWASAYAVAKGIL